MHTLVRLGCLVMVTLAASSPAAAAESAAHKPRIPVEAPSGTTHAGWGRGPLA